MQKKKKENYGKLYGTCEIKEVFPLIISHDAGRLNSQIRKRSRQTVSEHIQRPSFLRFPDAKHADLFDEPANQV